MDAVIHSRRACSQPSFLYGYLQGLEAQPCQHKHRRQRHLVTIGRSPASGQASAHVSGKRKTNSTAGKTANTSRTTRQLFPKHNKQAGELEFAASRQRLAKKAASQVRKLGPVQQGGLQSAKALLPDPFTLAADRILVCLAMLHTWIML